MSHWAASVLPFVLALSACAPAAEPSPTAAPATSIAPRPTSTRRPPAQWNTPAPTWTAAPPFKYEATDEDLERLITTDALAELSTDLGVANWQLDEGDAGRACREFVGEGKMMVPIPAGNCILGAGGWSLHEVLDYLKQVQSIKPEAVAIESAYEQGSDYALYRYFDKSRLYAVYDAILVKDDLVYWVWIDFAPGMFFGPESIYEEYGAAVDTFLHSILMRNQPPSP